MKTNKKGSHAIQSNHSKKIYIILVLIILIVIFAYFIIKHPTSNTDSSSPEFNQLAHSDIHAFENSTNLISQDFSINIENGLSKISGTITNTSTDVLNNIDCTYTLLDSYNNIIYEFDIRISELKYNNPTSFSSVCAVDLTNVTSYNVKLSK